MICLIYGSQIATIKTREKRLVNEFLDTPDEFNFVRLNGMEVTVQDIVEECRSLPLGYDKKVVIVEDAYFLSKPKPKTSIESLQDYDKLKKYLQTNNPDTILILTLVATSIDKSNEFYQAILKQEDHREYALAEPTKEEYVSYVTQHFNQRLNCQITREAVDELIARVGSDLVSFQNNANKLASYKNGETITYDDVCLLVSPPLEDNAFQIFNNLIRKKNREALSIYRDLKTQNVEVITLISMLANQFRLLNEVSYLAKNKYSDDQIAKELSLSPTRAKILHGNMRYISTDYINKTLEDLYKLDFDIKSGSVDRFYMFELYLVNFSPY